MKVEVQVIYEKGKSARYRDRAKARTYCGTLRVREERVQALGRHATIAAVVSQTDGLDSQVLPALHDAELLYVDGSKLRIRGFELVEDAQYGQTWDVKVV